VKLANDYKNNPTTNSFNKERNGIGATLLKKVTLMMKKIIQD